MRRGLLIPALVGALVGLVGLGAAPAWAGGQEEPPPVDSSVTGGTDTVVPDTTPTTDETGSETPLPTTATTAPGTTVVSPVPTLPPECEPPPAPKVIFVGRVTAAADGVGRFAVDAVRSDPDGIVEIGQLIDVEIGADLRFLKFGDRYLVAAEQTETGILRSKVRQPQPLFGGDQVVGIDDFGVQCPTLIDPIVVRNGDGSKVDTGVFSGFLDDKRGIALAFAKPTAAVLGALVGLWLLKYAVIGLWRAIVVLRRRLRRRRDERVARREWPASPAR